MAVSITLMCFRVILSCSPSVSCVIPVCLRAFAIRLPKYAAFIDESAVFAAQKMRELGDALAEMVMEKLKAVDGKCLIKCASVEFMSFIEDAYRSLRRREY